MLDHEKNTKAPLASPPELLGLYFETRYHNCLLVAGGLLEQPYLLWTAIQYAGETYEHALAELRRVKLAQDELKRQQTERMQEQMNAKAR